MLAPLVAVQTVFVRKELVAVVTGEPYFRNNFEVKLVRVRDVDVGHVGRAELAIDSRNRRVCCSPSLLRSFWKVEFRDRIEMPIPFDLSQMISICVSIHRLRGCEDLWTVAALVDSFLLLRLLVVPVTSVLVESRGVSET